MVGEIPLWKKSNQIVPSSVWTSASLSALLSGILLSELLIFTTYSYYQAERWLDPAYLGDQIESAVRENYPELRVNLIAQVEAKSPEIAERISQQLVATTPEARQQLERLTSRQLDAGLDQITQISREQFREMLRRNHDAIVAALEQIEQAPDEARRFVLKTEASLEDQMGIDLQRQARTALALHRDLNNKLERLQQPDAALDSKELLERRIVRLLRTIQEREASVQTAAHHSPTG